MVYSDDEFYRLMAQIEAPAVLPESPELLPEPLAPYRQGGEYAGEHLGDLHENVYHTHMAHWPDQEPQIPGYEVAYCGLPVEFEIPYIKPDGTVGSISSCAVDDAMGRWPRYAEANAAGTMKPWDADDLNLDFPED